MLYCCTLCETWTQITPQQRQYIHRLSVATLFLGRAARVGLAFQRRPSLDAYASVFRCFYKHTHVLNFATQHPPPSQANTFTQPHRADPLPPPVLQVVDDAAVASLAVTATNEYGRYSDAALALYGLEMIVEPYRETTLTATPWPPLGAGGADSDGGGRHSPPDASTSSFTWRLEEVVDGETVSTVFERSNAGLQTSVVLTKPGGVFRLTVEQYYHQYPTAQGAADSVTGATRLVARTTLTASCKYVRRELRELTDADRLDVLDAMEAYYTVPTEEGRAKYGEGFFNYELLTALHNADVSFEASFFRSRVRKRKE